MSTDQNPPSNFAAKFLARRGLTKSFSDILLESDAGIDTVKRIEGVPINSIADIDQKFSSLRYL